MTGHALVGLGIGIFAPALYPVGVAYYLGGAIDAHMKQQRGEVEATISCAPTTVCGNILYGFEYAIGFYVGTAMMNKVFGSNQ